MAGRAKTPEERAAKRAAALAAGLTTDAKWNPAPQVGQGNAVALQHGAYSPEVVNPIAERKLAWMLGPDWPDHIKVPYLRPMLREAAITEAQIELLDGEIEGMGIDEANSEVTDSEERVTGSMEGGNFRRTSYSRKRSSPLETRRRLSNHLTKLWNDLGLTPMARAKLGKDVSSTAVNLSQIYTEGDD